MNNSELQNLTIAIDNFDECEEATAKWLAREIAGCSTIMMASKASSPRFLIISRQIFGRDQLPSINLDGGDARKQQNSIRRYIDARLGDLTRIQGFEDHIRCEGSFLWLGCVIQELQNQKTCTDVLRCLAKLAQGLDPLYNRLLNQIDEEDRAGCSRIIQWVALAARPLALPALAEATGIQGSEGLSSQQALRDMVTSCGNLLKFDLLVFDASEGFPPATTVALIHLALKEYLCCTESSSSFSGISAFFFDNDNAQLDLTTRCVEYLQQNGVTSDSPDSFYESFTSYAIEHWPSHAGLSASQVLNLKEMQPKFFETGMSHYTWLSSRDNTYRPV